MLPGAPAKRSSDSWPPARSVKMVVHPPGWSDRAQMFKATIKGIFARRVRLALTAIAVLLGVTFVSASYVLTDTLQRSFNGIFRQTVSNVDLVVRASNPIVGSSNVQRIRMPEGVLEEVRRDPAVRAAEGIVVGQAQLLGKDGKAIQSGGTPNLGFSWAPRSRVGPFRLVHDGKSRAPRGSNEIVIDQGTARRNHFSVGDTVTVAPEGPARRYRVVGLFGFGDAFDFGSVTAVAFTLPTAQRAFAIPGQLDFVYVKGRAGVSRQALQDQLTNEVGPGFEVVSADQAARDIGAPVRSLLGFLNDALLGFALIGVVVASFIIFNTFVILVAQRTRELALMRAMGASGRQVIGSVVAEAVAVGLLASALGVALGLGLARLLLTVIGSFGFTPPKGPLVLLGRTITASFVVGVGVTVLASLVPALRAARTPPIAAINDVRPVAAPLRRRAVFGGVLLAIGMAVLSYGLVATPRTDFFAKIQVVGIGAFVVLVGAVILTATFARPLARAVGWPLSAGIGVTGTLARGNAMRNPRRTAATAAALVIGLSLVSLVAIFTASAKASVRSAIDSGLSADVVLSRKSFTTFSPLVAQQVAKLPQVEAVAPFRFVRSSVNGDAVIVAGTDPRTLVRVVNLHLVSGNVEGLDAGGILLAKDDADHYHVKTGDTVEISSPRGSGPVRVAGIYRSRNFTGGFPVPFIVSLTTYQNALSGAQVDSLAYVKAKPGSTAAARAEIKQALREPFPNIQVQTRDQFRQTQEHQIDNFLTVMIALLLLSEIIAVIGIINTLALSVFERTHELGLLRAVGMSRRQMRRMVRAEGVIIAVIGGIVGLAIGLLWGWVFTKALRAQGVSKFSVPPVEIAIFVAFSVLAGFVAALLPAWRAARLDVLEAIATE